MSHDPEQPAATTTQPGPLPRAKPAAKRKSANSNGASSKSRKRGEAAPAGASLTEPPAPPRQSSAKSAAATATVAAAAPAAPPPARPTPRQKAAEPAPSPKAEQPLAAAAAADVENGRHDSWGEFSIRDTPAWIVSAVVHAILVVVLAMMTYEVAPDDAQRAPIVTDLAEEDLAQIEETLEIETAVPKVKELNVDPLSAPLPQMGDFSEQENPLSAPETPLNDASTIEVGQVSAAEKFFGQRGAAMTRAKLPEGEAQFFGVKAGGRKFVFVVDGSKSMKGQNKWEHCKRELLYAVSRLGPRKYFYVVLFADKEYPMFGEGNIAPRPLLATPHNIERLRIWLYNFELVLKTKPYTSMKMALDMRPDAIYLLSDGMFRDQTEKFLKKNNRIDDPLVDSNYVAVVHTIGFFDNRGQPLLQKLANENGGVYRFVAPPPKPNKRPRKQKR